jgi:hypothetical protein
MAEDGLVTTDCLVAHVSTVPATTGKTVGLFLREKALASMSHTGYGPSPRPLMDDPCFERGRHLLYRATLDWLADGAVDGAQRGEFLADVQGRLTPSAA